MSLIARRYYLRGCSALERGEIESAIEAFRSATELAPRFSSARIGYAVALARAGDCPWAAQSLRTGLAYASTRPATAALWATLGDILTMSGDFLGAEEAFKNAAAVPGFEARASAGLARVYGKLGRYPEAVAALRSVAAMARVDQERPARDATAR